MRYALIRNGYVENVVEWDGETDWSPGPDYDVIDCPDEVGPGWLYDDGFSPPPVPDEDPA